MSRGAPDHSVDGKARPKTLVCYCARWTLWSLDVGERMKVVDDD